MRRVLLVALLLLAGLGAPALAADARPVLRLTDADAGRTVTVAPGTRVEVRLAAPAGGDVWQGLDQGGPTLHVVRYTSSSSGLEADLDALAPAPAQTLSARTDADCFHTLAPCARPSSGWQVQVVVSDGPADTSAVACTPGPRPTASPFPGAVTLTLADDGRTVEVPRDAPVTVQLDGCDEPGWRAPTASGPLFRASAQVERARGQVQSVFRPVEVGTATVTTVLDARCSHTAPACATTQRAFSVTVRVNATSYGACTRAGSPGFRVSPDHVAAGDPVTVSGPAPSECSLSPEPVHDFVLQASAGGQPFVDVDRRRGTAYRSEQHPAVTTRYRLLRDGVALSPEGADTVVVDRTSGSCAGLTLGGPARMAAGSTVVLNGYAPDTSTVTVRFRRRGEASFVARRTLVPGPDGRISTSFAAADDHRWYAATTRCDSLPGLTQAVPVVTGPAVVRRGETVTLHVLAQVGVRTLLFFRGPGEPFSPRRTFTGPGTTTYVATVDQRYYPRSPSTQGTARLTQVR